MNTYEEAIQSGLTQQFLLGRGKYFVLDRDWGIHDITYTYSKLLSYGKQHGEQNLYNQLNKDLLNILNEEFLSVVDLHNLIGIFWSNQIDLKENKLNITWKVPDDLKQAIQKQIQKHIKINSDISGILSSISDLKSKFNLDLY